jgi:hypothetical protein
MSEDYVQRMYSQSNMAVPNKRKIRAKKKIQPIVPANGNKNLTI